MALPDRLAGALAKYRRAQTHLTALTECVNEFQTSGYWHPERSAEVPEGRVRIRITGGVPPDLSLILGDAVHNLRAALDYATCSLVEFGNSRVDLKRVQFPFGRLGFPLNSAERKPLGPIAPHALIAIEECRRLVGPYLELLCLLSNQDKHRLLVTTVHRQFPIRIEIDLATQTGDFVPDLEGQPDVWFRPLADGDVIDMPNILHLKLGLVIEGASAPYAITAINEVSKAVATTLNLMAMVVQTPD